MRWRSSFRTVVAVAAAWASASIGSPTLAASAPAFTAPLAPAVPSKAGWRPDPDDALLFEVRLGKYRMGDGVRGYATPHGVCVDFADTILALDLAIRLDKQSRRATGWAFDEQQTILVDRVSAREQIEHTTREVAPDDIFDAPEGWCVATTTLSRWLGVTITPDMPNALLLVTADRKLAPELAAERRERVPVQRVAFDLAKLPHASAPWGGIKAPALDIVASAAVRADKGGGTAVAISYEAFAAGEVGPVAWDARLASAPDGTPATVRVRAYRIDPLGKLPLGATQIAVGDVHGGSTPVVAQSSIGRGAMISNRPIDRPEQFDRTEFRGDLPKGWDAELYRNGQLIAFANDRADGRYAFTDVPLQYGTNRFEVVLYGPQGQVRREVKSVPVGFDSIPPRTTWYQASIDQDGRDLIRFPGAGPGASALDVRGGWRAMAGIERGIDARTSLAAFAHTLVLPDGKRRSYVEAAVRRALGPALVELSGAHSLGGGSAVRVQALGQSGRFNFAGETIWAMPRFVSDRILADTRAQHALSLDYLAGIGRLQLPLHLDARLTQRRSGSDDLDLRARTSLGFRRIALTGGLAYHAGFGRMPVPGRLEAELLANGRVGRVLLRGEARLEVQPQARMSRVAVVGEWSAGRDPDRPALWRAELGYDALTSRGRVALGYTRRFERLALSANAEAASDGSVAAGLQVAFSIGRNPGPGGLRVASAHLASRGSVAVRVFRDTNHNGVRDVGEPWERGVAIAAGRSPIAGATDANGRLMADDLEPFRPTLIAIDTASLPDPLVQPAGPGVVVTPRPGVPTTIDLPLVSAGDVDGTLVRDGGGALSAVNLELVDRAGTVVAVTRTDFDGFFVFEGVPYGEYSARVALLSAQANAISPALAPHATVNGKTPSAHLGIVAAHDARARQVAQAAR